MNNLHRGFVTSPFRLTRLLALCRETMALVRSTFGNNLPGWFKGPQGRPSVIVLQEWWGVTEEVKRQAEYISTTKNYRVLIPDLYK